MRIKIKEYDLMISGFGISDDDLVSLTGALVAALQVLHPTSFQPVIIKNADDDLFGKSININYRHYNKPKFLRIN